MIKTFRYRIYPSKRQTETLFQMLAICCELYNAGLQERREAWRIQRKSIGFRQQSNQLPEIRAERADVRGVYAQVLQDTLHRVDKSFQGFFRRVRRKEKAGFPRFRSRDRYDSLTYPQQGFKIEAGRLNLSRVGDMRIKLHRPTEGKIKTLTIKREAGRWFALFACEVEPQSLPFNPNMIGIDVGLTHFATLSDGTAIENPRHYRNGERALRLAQRRVTRRKKGSQRRRKAIQIMQRAHAYVRNQRASFHHKLSREIVNGNGLTVVEDLNVRGMVRNHNLAKSINDAGWSNFIYMLSYKAESAGRLLIKVDPRGTSQTCICGAEVRKTLAQRWHLCLSCGLSAPRDHVSAHLILRLGLSLQAPRATVAFA